MNTTQTNQASNNRATVRISPWQVKALLASYASHATRSARSQLGERKGGAAGSCLLTIGIIVSRTPAAYRVQGESILDRWCAAREVEAGIVDEIAATRSKRNCTTKANVSDECDRRLVELGHALELATEQVYGVEGNSRFDAALSWMAGDLERRLEIVTTSELLMWSEILGGLSLR